MLDCILLLFPLTNALLVMAPGVVPYAWLKNDNILTVTNGNDGDSAIPFTNECFPGYADVVNSLEISPEKSNIIGTYESDDVNDNVRDAVFVEDNENEYGPYNL